MGMFARVRWRLLGWNTLVIMLLVVLVGAAVYASLARSLSAEVDRTLAATGDTTAQRLHEHGDAGYHFEQQGYSGGDFALVLGADGQSLANPQGVDLAAWSRELASDPTTRYRTVSLGDDRPIRLYIRPVPGPRTPPEMLVVGQSTGAQEETLERLLVLLLAGGGLGLLLALAGAWFLAGRALLPIQHAFRRQREFVADAAHELRTPLTVLRAATEMLEQRRAESLAANGALFDDVRAEITRLEHLTGDLLSLARSDLEPVELAVADVDLRALLADAVRRAIPLAGERGISLAYAGDDEPLVIEADPDRLHQVAMIVLDNAIKYTPAGGRITVAAGRRGGEAVATIRDTGEGIPAEHLPRLFDRFYRADHARSRAHGGTGLGLAIAQSLVHAHGGQIAVTSSAGDGTTVRIQLPIDGSGGSLGDRVVRRPWRIASGPAPE
jgi:signal transduction histidine kinase